MMMKKPKKEVCDFCGKNKFLKSDEGDSIWWLNPNDWYGKRVRKDTNGNVQVNINMPKYPDAMPGDDVNAVFKFNYCPVCGRRLD